MKKAQSPVRNKTPKVSVSGFRKKFLTGQSSLEYAIVIVAIIAALLGMQAYTKRGLQGRLRATADELSAQQYEPRNTVSDITTTQNSDITTNTQTEIIDNGKKYNTTTTTNINYQEESRYGSENIVQ